MPICSGATNSDSQFRIQRDYQPRALSLNQNQEMNDPLTHAECGNCGWIGALKEAKEHPTRPMPMDGGFCPTCGLEFNLWITESEANRLIAEYDE